MFKPTFTEPSRRSHQRGDMLIESMLALLLLGVMGLSLGLAVAHASLVQKNMAVRNIALAQLRDLLEHNGTSLKDSSGQTVAINLCSGTPTITLPGGVSLAVTVSGCNTTSLSLGGVTVAGVAMPLKLTVSDALLDGSLSVGGGS